MNSLDYIDSIFKNALDYYQKKVLKYFVIWEFFIIFAV